MDLEAKIKRNTKITLLKCSWDIEGSQILSGDKYYLTLNEKEIIKYLLSHQIPKNLRRKLWLIASGAKREIKNNKDYYKKLLKLSEEIPLLHASQIKVDLKRTFPEDIAFNTEETMNKMKRILNCYAVRNCSIGYCQGFNFIVARLIQVLNDEEEVFWVFTQLIEEILPLNYYSELAGIITDCTLLNILIEKYLPDLYKFLIEIGFEMILNNFIHKWLVSLYIQNFNDSLSMKIWDFLFLEGNIVLFKSAIAILKNLKNAIMSNENFEDVYFALNSKTSEIDIDNLVYYLTLKRFEFDYMFLKTHRDVLTKTVVDSIRKENEINLKIKNKILSQLEKKEENCDVDYPVCINELDKDFQRTVNSVIVLRLKNVDNFIIDNYFCASNINAFLERRNNFQDNDSEDILIERRKHTCEKIDQRDSNEKNLKLDKDPEDDKNINYSFRKRRKSLVYFHRLDKNIQNSKKNEEHIEFANIYEKIKTDEDFSLANKMLSTFTPKPLKDNEY